MDNLRYAPNFSSPEEWSERDRYYLAPFVTSMDGLVSVLRNLPPELAGALCSRASRASDSLLRVLLKEYIYPVLEGEDKELAAELEEVVAFFHAHGLKSVLNNKKAQQFYAKWLPGRRAEFITPQAGGCLVLWGVLSGWRE